MRNFLTVFVSILSLFSSHFLFGAGPVTHTFLAEKWIEKNQQFPKTEQAAFFVGTLFPDIRYLVGSDRSSTHEMEVSLEEIGRAPSAFIKGKKFHSFVDNIRAALVEKWKILDSLQSVPQEHRDTFLKLVEDEILFKEIDASKMCSYLNALDPEEKKYNISESDLTHWHNRLKFCFNVPPSSFLAKLASEKKGEFGISPELIAIWSKALPLSAKDKGINRYVRDLLNAFDETLKPKAHKTDDQ